ncbi:MAG: preprotein translocase subunit SecE [Candidatus Bipolaricaulota bacterium]|nr:preprotein translocase subunit SecE [Candidatus Bipolaricaulota bacterium]
MRDRVVTFFREIYGEFRRVSWPSRLEVIGLTTLVIIIIVLLSIYVGIWDWIFRNFVEFLLQRR